MAQWKLPYKHLKFNNNIGKGNFGEVYDGEYLGTRVAIKKLYFVDDDLMQKYIEREMDTLTGLAHPNIVQLIGLCIETDDMYIVTEFVSGGDLRSKLKDESIKMDWPTRLAIARDIALAMNYLHSKNIMHRDLKSHNLLVAEGWKIKVCDFGLARSAPSDDGERNLMTIVGTNEWMAPEVAMGDRYTLSADVFSYGMVLYELITREKPPPRNLKDMVSFDTAKLKPQIPADAPEALAALMFECISHIPDSRPTFAEIVKRLLNMIKEYQSGGTSKSDTPAAAAKGEEGGKKKKGKKKGDGTKKKKKKKPAAETGKKGDEKAPKKARKGEEKEPVKEAPKKSEKKSTTEKPADTKKSTAEKPVEKPADTKKSTAEKPAENKKSTVDKPAEKKSTVKEGSGNKKKGGDEKGAAKKEEPKGKKKAEKKEETNGDKKGEDGKRKSARKSKEDPKKGNDTKKTKK